MTAVTVLTDGSLLVTLLGQNTVLTFPVSVDRALLVLVAVGAIHPIQPRSMWPLLNSVEGLVAVDAVEVRVDGPCIEFLIHEERDLAPITLHLQSGLAVALQAEGSVLP